MKQFFTVFSYHFKESAFSKTATITMAITLVATLAIFGGIHWFIQSQEPAEIAIIQTSDTFVIDEAILNEILEEVNFRFEAYNQLDNLRTALENGDIDTIFILDGEDVPVITSIHENRSHLESEMVITQLLQQQYLAHVMGDNEVSPEVVEQLLTPVQVNYEPLRNQEEAMIGNAMGQIFGMALYFILIICGQVVANGIVSEKSSRVMEIMISKVKPIYMMYAKILVSLTNILVFVVPIVLGTMIANQLGWFAMGDFMELLASLELDSHIFIIGGIFLVLGYLLYSLLFAAAGAMSSSSETLATVTTPLFAAIMIPYFTLILFPAESLIMRVMSYIPFFSPFVTFNRYASGIASLTEVGISVAIIVVTILILGKLTTRVYINGVMRYSEKVSFKDVKQLLQKQ